MAMPMRLGPQDMYGRPPEGPFPPHVMPPFPSPSFGSGKGSVCGVVIVDSVLEILRGFVVWSTVSTRQYHCGYWVLA